MKKRLFPLLIALSALAVSGSAAFYSVFGLSKLFAGASTQVIIMAGSLEFAKLVVASLLYQYWDTINKFLRFYLAIACFVLILITSGGIYGFLSGAYQSTATQSELLDKSLMILNQKQVRFEEQKEDLKSEKQALTKSISDLRIALSNPTQVQYIDKESGTLITTSSSSARRALQSELTIATTNRDGINIKIESVMDSINRTDMALLNKEISNESERELGPLKYLAETTGKDMNQVVNWFLLLIIFVFDPLAIALVIAANMAFAQIKPKINPDLQNPTKPANNQKSSIVLEKEDLMLDDMEYGEIQNIIDQEGIDIQYFNDLKKHNYTIDEGERRMNIIGQNGNEGLHYNDKDIALDRLTDTTQTLLVEKKDNIRIIKSNDDLEEKELIELSKEIGTQEGNNHIDPINPTEEDLEKLASALNISKKEEDDDRTLKYKGR